MSLRSNVLTGFAKLASRLALEDYSESQLARVGEALDALAENPQAVSVNRRTLSVIWPDSERHLGVERNGFLLIIINSSHWRKKSRIKSVVMAAGVLDHRIKFIKGDEDVQDIENMIGENACRAVMFSKEIPSRVRSLLADETSQACKSLQDQDVQTAIELLRQKLA